MNNFVKINDLLVPENTIRSIDISNMTTETVQVILFDGTVHMVSGFDAILLVWYVKPSALEGRRDIKWKKHMWWVHNMIAHPLMQILAWLKMYPLAIWIHDVTVPKPIDIRR